MGNDEDIRECPDCNGKGRVDWLLGERTCDRCKGTGEVIKRRKFNA